RQVCNNFVVLLPPLWRISGRGFTLNETKLRGLSGGIYEADIYANSEIRAMQTDAPPFSSGNAGN
ncbi:MAG: hypothetical protein LBB56_07785, partial [Chitinispirillales bacterium]|nr:hypothetical protein [Chitinispirillales bacterium]